MENYILKVSILILCSYSNFKHSARQCILKGKRPLSDRLTDKDSEHTPTSIQSSTHADIQFHNLRQAILKGSMAPTGKTSDLDISQVTYNK